MIEFKVVDIIIETETSEDNMKTPIWRSMTISYQFDKVQRIEFEMIFEHGAVLLLFQV